MNIKTAIQTAHRQAGKQTPWSDLHVDLDRVVGQSQTGGVVCSLDTPVGLKLALPGEQLVKAVRVLDEPVVEKGKGATCKLSQHDLSFSIKGRLIKDDESVTVPVNTGAVTSLDNEQLKAIHAAGKMIDPADKVTPILSGLHFEPTWVGGANQMMAWVVWVGAVNQSITVSPDVMNLIDHEPDDVWIADRRLYVKTKEIVQWSQGFAAEYPAGAIMDMVASGRVHDGKTVVKIDIGACRQLFKAAQAASLAPAEAFRIKLIGNKLTVYRPQDDLPEFEGSVTCAEVFREESPGEEIGITPAAMLKSFDLCVEEADYFMAVGAKNDKIALWGGDKVKIEIVILPSYLP